MRVGAFIPTRLVVRSDCVSNPDMNEDALQRREYIVQYMKLIEALETLRRPVSDDAPEFNVFLACGFTPLHLRKTFWLPEYASASSPIGVDDETGLFGDLAGNIERLNPPAVNSLVVV